MCCCRKRPPPPAQLLAIQGVQWELGIAPSVAARKNLAAALALIVWRFEETLPAKNPRALEPGTLVRMDLQFIKPFQADNIAEFHFQSEAKVEEVPVR